MSGSPRIPNDRDLELLSIYLDGELSDRARETLEQRIAADPTLRDELATLRQTVQMVRSLPTLRAPRNFTLDPALFSRPVPWWQRLLSLGTVLQTAGALGTAVSIIVIAVALLTSSSMDQNEMLTSATDVSQPTSNEVALQSTLPTEIAPTAELSYDLQATQNPAAARFFATPTFAGQSGMFAAEVAADVADSAADASQSPTDQMPAGTPAPAQAAVPPPAAFGDMQDAVTEGIGAEPPAQPITIPQMAASDSAEEPNTASDGTADSAELAQSGHEDDGMFAAPDPQPGAVETERGDNSTEKLGEAQDEDAPSLSTTPTEESQGSQLAIVAGIALAISLMAWVIGWRRSRV